MLRMIPSTVAKSDVESVAACVPCGSSTATRASGVTVQSEQVVPAAHEGGVEKPFAPGCWSNAKDAQAAGGKFAHAPWTHATPIGPDAHGKAPGGGQPSFLKVAQVVAFTSSIVD
jgi:hypothetical protein